MLSILLRERDNILKSRFTIYEYYFGQKTSVKRGNFYNKQQATLALVESHCTYLLLQTSNSNFYNKQQATLALVESHCEI